MWDPVCAEDRKLETMVIWMRLPSIGSYIWMLGLQLVELFGKDLEVQPCWRCACFGSWLWDFRNTCYVQLAFFFSVLCCEHLQTFTYYFSFGSQTYLRLPQRPWWKDKGDTSSVSLSRSRLGKVQFGARAWALKELQVWFLGTQLSSLEDCGYQI